MDLLDELKERGLLSQSTDEDALRETLKKPIKFYCGFDPTAPSLHHGNLVQIIMMRHLQNAGHTPVVVVGGGTGLIGDPREKSERTLNDKEVVEQWVKKIRLQFNNILDFEAKNAPIVVNNYDWISKISAIELLRDIGKSFRMGTMIAKETVAKRLKSDEGISYTEFSYQVLQSYDYLHLFEEYGVVLQTGGNDQWGNLTSGVDLIHKVKGETVHAMTTPLITKADGTKFGKTESGAVWLDPQLMSPYAFYQFWFNVADEDVIKLLKAYTFLSLDKIAEIEKEHNEAKHLRIAQKVLAYEVTSLIHGKDIVEKLIKASEMMFSPKADFTEIDFDVLSQATKELPAGEAKKDDSVFQVLMSSTLFNGSNDIRRAIKEGSVYINNKRISDTDSPVDPSDIVKNEKTNDNFVVVRRGKKKMARVDLA